MLSVWPEQAQARRAIQQMNDQNQRRMAAEMRRAKEAKEQAEKDAKAAILREQRAKLARRQAAENEKKQEEEEQIQRTLDRKRRAAEERELTLKAMYETPICACVSGGDLRATYLVAGAR